MIIDARTATAPGHGRPYTLSAAVSMALDEVPVGEFREVTELKDQLGDDVPWPRLNMLISKHSNGRKFTCRTVAGGVRIWRIA